MNRKLLVAGCAPLLFINTARARGAEPGVKIWIVPSIERVGPRDPATATVKAQLYAARGEYESFQIVISAGSSRLTGVNISTSDLLGDHAKIDRSSITLYREHYVHVIRSSPDWHGANRPLGAGWYPDGLIPISGWEAQRTDSRSRAFDVEAGTDQPVWVDIFIPRESHPGAYRATFTIRSGQVDIRIAAEVHVWNFELPVRPTLISSFGYWGPPQREVTEELLKHKIMPQIVTACRGDEPKGCLGNAGVERHLIDAFGLGATDTHFWSGASNDNCKMTPAPAVSAFRKARAAHQADLLLYNYTADEIHDCPDLVASMKQWAANMHRAGILNLLTIGPNELYEDAGGRPAVDIWAMTPAVYDKNRDAIGKARSFGARFWSYNGLVQDGYSPKWQIDFLPINYRIQPGFISQSLGLTGLLYWRVDRWDGDPWSDAIDNTGYFAQGVSYPGDGFLVYPGAQAGVRGVIASMRLKQIRDGIEDYEYVEALKKLGRGDWALEVCRTVGADWAHWTRDSSALYAARKKLGDEIDRLSTVRSTMATAGSVAWSNRK